MKGKKDRQYGVEKTIYHHCYQALLYGLSVLSLLLFSFYAQAQDDNAEEILISVSVQGVGVTEMPAVILGDSIMLPITELFDYLKIKNTTTPGLDSVYGFFITQEGIYTFDRIHNAIQFMDKVYPLGPSGMVKTETGLYINIKYLGEIFGLESKFNFRALLVDINSKTELPVVREARLALIRNNISRLKGKLQADTTIPRGHPFFRFGMADWSVIANQQIMDNGTVQTENRIGLGLGGALVGGEVNAILNYSPEQPFEDKRQYYLWRKVNNEAKVAKQVMVGKIPTQTIASIFAPVVGAEITNRPTTVRQSFGSYTLSNVTEPGWVVELYVNNVLVDYTKADESGFYTFQVPLVYGSSVVKLKFYGPYGEVKSHEENISIPFNFLPPQVAEYNISAGVLEDDSTSRFGRGVLNYGLGKKLTVGGGVEYLSNVTSGNVMPFVNGSGRIGSGLLLSGEYAHTVRSKGGLSYRLPSNVQFEMVYTRYAKGQTAVNTGATEERKAVISMPVKSLKFSMFTMLTVNQTVLPSTKYTNAEWLLSGVFLGVGTNISTYGVFIDKSTPYIYSNVSMAFRLPRAFTFTTQFQYEYGHGQFISAKGLLEKRIFAIAYLNLSYEQNFKSNFNNIGMQFRYDLPFTQVGTTAFYSNKNLSLLQSARGSLIYDDKSNYATLRNNINVGRGGVVVMPYLDMNCNGQHDAGEPKVSGLKFRINTGRIQPESKDTTIRVFDLEPYSDCYIELSRFSFDNIAWQIRKKTISLTVEPNIFTKIDVPVAVVAEVSGSVYLDKNNTKRGQGQIYVCFYKNDTLIARTLTEPDGYFSYIGLAPGAYTAAIDSAQMQRVNMKASAPLPFNVLSTVDGDIIEGLEFIVHSMNNAAGKKEDDSDK